MGWESLPLDQGKEGGQEPEMERLPGVGPASARALRWGKGWQVSRLREEHRQQLPLAMGISLNMSAAGLQRESVKLC